MSGGEILRRSRPERAEPSGVQTCMQSTAGPSSTQTPSAPSSAAVQPGNGRAHPNVPKPVLHAIRDPSSSFRGVIDATSLTPALQHRQPIRRPSNGPRDPCISPPLRRPTKPVSHHTSQQPSRASLDASGQTLAIQGRGLCRDQPQPTTIQPALVVQEPAQQNAAQMAKLLELSRVQAKALIDLKQEIKARRTVELAQHERLETLIRSLGAPEAELDDEGLIRSLGTPEAEFDHVSSGTRPREPVSKSTESEPTIKEMLMQLQQQVQQQGTTLDALHSMSEPASQELMKHLQQLVGQQGATFHALQAQSDPIKEELKQLRQQVEQQGTTSNAVHSKWLPAVMHSCTSNASAHTAKLDSLQQDVENLAEASAEADVMLRALKKDMRLQSSGQHAADLKSLRADVQKLTAATSAAAQARPRTPAGRGRPPGSRNLKTELEQGMQHLTTSLQQSMGELGFDSVAAACQQASMLCNLHTT